uniref:IRS-type PTB domain-containing protein n=1 Tax=Heligmosomoides polygyrus TaxID=6339 RepID=A0A8L8JXS5_HELPZ
LYLQLSVMLRSAMVAARMTPLHRYYVKKQSCDTFVILYKLSEGFSELDLGSEAKRLELGRFPTPAGAFRLELAYRTQMAKERATTPAEGQESPNQLSIIMTTTPEITAAVGSPTPSSYCELLSEFSTSPSSLAAASPPDATSPHLKPGRSRSTSLASDGEPASSGSPKPRPNVPVVKNMPFANLLEVSYTGVLFPLKEEAPVRRKTNSESAIVVGTAAGVVVPPRCDSFSRLLGAHHHATVPEEERRDFAEENQETEMESEAREELDRLKVEDDGERPPVKVSFELEISERTLVDQDSDSQTEGSRKGELDVEDPEESVATIKHSEGDGADQDEVVGVSDDDSFVKIPLFGRASGADVSQEGELDVHLTEFMSSCKAPPPLEAVHPDWDTLADIKSLLDGFSQKQGVFDKFVAEVREHGDNND